MKYLREILIGLTFFVLIKANGQITIDISPSLISGNENLRWSIAGNSSGDDPNVLSELHWKNLTDLGYSGAVRIKANRLSMFSDIRQTFTISGTVTDTDYSEDNRRNKVFHAKEDAGNGGITQIRMSGGFELLKSRNYSFSITSGYGILKQELYLKNMRAGLNSRYSNSWEGLLILAIMDLKVPDGLTGRIQSTYSQIKYNAIGNWNLIEEFEHPVSFRHKAKGFGLDSEAVIMRDISSRLSVSAGGAFSIWTTGRGVDTLYKTNKTTPKTQLNDVTRKALSLRLGLKILII